MKFLFTAIFLFFYSPFLFSQSIDISFPAEQDYNTNRFPSGDGTVTVTGSQFVLGSATIANPIAWSFSSSNRRASFLQRSNGVYVTGYNSGGEILVERIMEFFEPTDNTMNTYQFDTGKIILRDNVANFTFLNPKGESGYSVSNSSGSPEGERESQLASDPFGNTIVLYNPVISFGSQTGSRAQIVYGNQDTNVIFNSGTEEIRSVRLSDDGSFITILSEDNQVNRVSIFDRFGNEIYQLESDEDLIGTTLNEEATHLTIYSSGRVQVYEVPSGNRVGSASSRSSTIFAGYDPDSQTIIALGGSLDGRVIDNPEITAVSISQRAIAREDIPFSVSTLDLKRLELSKSGSQYEISGLNRRLLIDVTF